jgi:plastocyanin
MRRHLTTILPCALAGALLVASAAAVAQSAAGGGPVVVGQKDRAFSQEALEVRSGATVRFTNDDSVAHNIVVRDPAGATRATPLQRPGEHTDIAFAAAGEHEVRCALHPRMRMTVRAQN